MSGTVEWLPKTATEEVVRYADFADELAAGETVTTFNATAVTVYSGNDPGVTLTVAPNVVDNAAGLPTVLSCLVSAGVLGAIYQVVLSANTSAGRIITKTALVAVKPPYN